jgi:CpeT/CpcT family (DUF1001)
MCDRLSLNSRHSLVPVLLFAMLLSFTTVVASQPVDAAQNKGVAPKTAPSPALDADFQRFISWFGGEWNNNEQVWQQQVDIKAKPADAKSTDKATPEADEKITHTHHIFAPVVAPKIGSHVFYVQQSLNGDLSKAYRQRVYRFTQDTTENAIKLEIFTPLDEKAFFDAHKRPEMFADVDLTKLRAAPGCEVFWRYEAATKSYAGTMKPNACSFVSQRYGGKRIFISDTLKLTENEIWINDQARDEQGGYVFGSKTNTPVKNRKVRYFTGWVYLHRDGPKADISDKKFSFRRDIMIHNEGQRVPILYDDGAESPYLLELAQLTYQNTRTAILKMAVIDKATMKNVFYIWAQPDGTRVGINHGWIQVGLTQKASRVAYGFGDPPAPTQPGTQSATP